MIEKIISRYSNKGHDIVKQWEEFGRIAPVDDFVNNYVAKNPISILFLDILFKDVTVVTNEVIEPVNRSIRGAPVKTTPCLIWNNRDQARRGEYSLFNII